MRLYQVLRQKAGSLRKLCDASKKVLKVLATPPATVTAADLLVTLEQKIV